MRARDIPNLITIGRILLVIPVTWALLDGRYALALALFFIAGFSDALDGFLAKHFHWTSRLGALLDPLADKALLISCYAALTWNALLPAWLFGLVVLRDVVIVSGAVLYNFRVERLDARPTLVSKLNTLLQIVLVLLVIFHQATGYGDSQWITWLVYAVTLSILWSGLDYVITWGRRARDHS
ncbi:cardiolipin synthase [Thiogranum longum]|uniref:CDP-diacylglycerol--glycerol-3-phosphate 3-phosphatidyltransferase n=1 Tax=Thiogranum longum TaxID=1537524 RepID=A0A4R1HC72_9GAMM|nr:CDP-alcohol phosphatidyltransferase family protein [Thiogranum longum]TCK17835.1 cardiolipin synthase [Thiogranum longum]